MKAIRQSEDRKETLKHFWIRFAALTLFWVVLFIALEPLSAENIAARSKYVNLIGGSVNGISPKLVRRLKITQPIRAEYDNWNGLDIRFGTYSHTSLARFTLAIRDGDGKTLYRESIDSSTLEDNRFYHIDVPEQTDSKGKEYYIVVTGVNGNENNSPVIWAMTPKGDPVAEVNGEPADFVLQLSLSYTRSGPYPILLILIVVLSYAFVALARHADERTFLCLCLLVGVLYIIITPFSHPLDEYTHFLKAYAISNMNPREDVVNEKIGFVVPYRVGSIPEFSLQSDADLINQPFEKLDDFVENSYSSSIIPINHTILALGLLIARLLHMSMGLTIWFGRLFNYLFYVAVCYLAIKNAKYYKSVFFTIAALPAAIWMAASYSTDPILLSTSLLFISICMKYRFSDQWVKISRKDMLLLLCCGVCFASVKYFIYLPIATCFFLIPKECFEKNQRRNMILAAIFAVLILAIWQYRLLNRYPIVEDRNGDTNFQGQIEFVFGHIYYTVRNFLNWILSSLLSRVNTTFYDSPYSSLSSTLALLGIFSATIASDKYPAERIGRIHAVRIHMVAIFMLSTVMIMASLYAAFTPVGDFTIAGIQNRYFQPLLICIMLPMAMTKIENRDEYHDTLLVILVTLSLLLAMTGALMTSML